MGNKKSSAGQAAGAGTRKYPAFDAIDGRHPFRDAVPGGFVDYFARTRHGGRVFYFNFPLAKEIGLLPQHHEHALNADLERKLLETFSLQIINEYDIIHATPIPDEDIRPHRYMATRYLQPQHPGRKGTTSGDGRGIWNGVVAGHDRTWDISSCGTGATCLSPATAQHGKFFRTGDPTVSYGCGRADLVEGACAALMSEIMHLNRISTERTLTVIAFDDNTSINVRAAPSLMRPAHFFGHLKQDNHQALQGAVDFYIGRNVANGNWPRIVAAEERYRHMLESVADSFATAAARFESEYIFCWMDWDGDNILCDGGIIDYGSLRQFGLYHHEYRYDDVDRYSTTITEQKNKAKYIVQTFAQIADYLITGKKKNIKAFRRHRILKQFDETFEAVKDRAMLYKLGFTDKWRDLLIADRQASGEIRKFRQVCEYFEKAKAARGPHEVSDGITWDAIFCLRDVLRELPGCYLEQDDGSIDPESFIDIMASNYATAADRELTSYRRRRIREFQRLYRRLVRRVADLAGTGERQVLERMAERVAVIDRYDRITGDGILAVAEILVEQERKLGLDAMHRIVEEFIDDQVLHPDYKPGRRRSHDAGKTRQTLVRIRELVRDYREGI